MKTSDIKAGQKYIRIDPITKSQTIYLGFVKYQYNPDRIVDRGLVIITSQFPHLIGQVVKKKGDNKAYKKFWDELIEYDKSIII